MPTIELNKQTSRQDQTTNGKQQTANKRPTYIHTYIHTSHFYLQFIQLLNTQPTTTINSFRTHTHCSLILNGTYFCQHSEKNQTNKNAGPFSKGLFGSVVLSFFSDFCLFVSFW